MSATCAHATTHRITTTLRDCALPATSRVYRAQMELLVRPVWVVTVMAQLYVGAVVIPTTMEHQLIV